MKEKGALYEEGEFERGQIATSLEVDDFVEGRFDISVLFRNDILIE